MGRDQDHVTFIYILGPAPYIGLGEAAHFKFRTQIEYTIQQIISHCNSTAKGVSTFLG